MSAGVEQLLWIDEVHDRAHAADRRSRYGAYLLQRAVEFREEGVLTDDPAEFARVAFLTACSPIMSPGYVRAHQRVRFVQWCWDDDGAPGVQVELAAPPPASLVRVLNDGRWRGWVRHGWGENEWYEEPVDLPAAFTTVTLRVALDVLALPGAAYSAGGVAELGAAKAAVAVVVRRVNDRAGAALAALEGVGR